MELKSLHKNAVAAAFEKANHYRLLNDPENAESICLDILHVEPDHQEAIVTLILAISDQFVGGSKRIKEAQSYVEKLVDEFQKAYYAGLICERAARAVLKKSTPRSNSTAFAWLKEAMHYYETAESLSSDQNDDGVLRWNSCARTILKHQLKPRIGDNYVAYGD
jgi:hypothetical protein